MIFSFENVSTTVKTFFSSSTFRIIFHCDKKYFDLFHLLSFWERLANCYFLRRSNDIVDFSFRKRELGGLPRYVGRQLSEQRRPPSNRFHFSLLNVLLIGPRPQPRGREESTNENARRQARVSSVYSPLPPIRKPGFFGSCLDVPKKMLMNYAPFLPFGKRGFSLSREKRNRIPDTPGFPQSKSAPPPPSQYLCGCMLYIFFCIYV